MLLTEEPTNGLGHFGCGMCPTWAQELKFVYDQDGNQMFNEDGVPYQELDQEVAGREMWDHVQEAHPDEA